MAAELIPPVPAAAREGSPVAAVLAALAGRPGAAAFLVKRGGRFEPVSGAEAVAAVLEVAAGLRAAGIRPGDRVLLLSENRLEWALADLGTLLAGAADVPVYPTSLAPQVGEILRDSGPRAAFVSSREQLAKLREAAAGEAAADSLVVFDEDAGGGGARGLGDLRARGREALAADPGLAARLVSEVRPEALASIVYTSGTTGAPKGVRLTHRNFQANILAALRRVPEAREGEVALSILPLSHVLERMAGFYGMLERGVAVAYGDSVLSLAEDLRLARPTVIAAVPRFFQKLADRVEESIRAAPLHRRALARAAFAVGRAWSRRVESGRRLPLSLRLARAVADALVFSRIRERLGGRLSLAISGGAPLGTELARLFHAAGVLVLEGYGLTETSPVIAVNGHDRFRFGTVGRPLDGVEVRIAADGEIEVRGPNVTEGYHGRPAETAEAFTPDGFLRTGDVGYLDPDGFLVITDRKKDLLVTSGGKKIVPAVLEGRLRGDPLVSEAVLIGSGRNFATALVVANLDSVRSALPAASAAAGGDGEALLQRSEVRKLFSERIAALQRDQPRFARVRRFTLLARPFSEEAGELTPTQKVRRKAVAQRHARAIDAMYRGGGVEVAGEEREMDGAARS
ncbi:MAG: long-chain fatty acid--CoA ligase [Planctomycetales bacterium]|nr:long-chain fatty acid--CoA ligase [Planctomycetales bacterium]